MTHTFGRLPSPVDPRDRAFLLSAHAPTRGLPTRRTWQFRHTPLDQGERPQCVAYSWLGMLLASPIATSPLAPKESVPHYADALYRQAQTLDDMPGERYDGTTVRGAAKALRARGLIDSYLWASTADEVVRYVLARGPVVIGVEWFEGMTDLARGAVACRTGASLGGHAVLIVGADRERQRVRILNSWGPDWGENGRCWLACTDLDALLRDGGEACSALEVAR